VSQSIKTPEWVKDAIFYQIFPDRFAKSLRVQKPSNLEAWDAPPTTNGFKGGDLLGVAEHLDYLEDLGVNAIYFNPIFQSASNHRYHTHDYYRVDPILGGNEAFRVLLDAAHARGIRVVLDGVFNHASRGFFQFNHILECGEQSPYLDWFTVKGFPLNAYDHTQKPNYKAWVGLHALPEFNVANPQVREFIFGIAEYWIRFGIDGWRLDVPYEIDDDSFWQAFRLRVRDANPEAYLVGEIWHEAQRWLQGDQFDAVMNYIQTRACIAFFGAKTLAPLEPGGGYARLKPMTAQDFAREIERMLNLYDWEVTTVQLNLLSSHDTARFITMVDNNRSALKLAMLFQLTMPGAPPSTTG
jgi:glycosidase